jgi:hypothetical protein
MWIESEVIIQRGQQVYRVIDNQGDHYFRSAKSANEEFPGAFDAHPDFEEPDVTCVLS